jgi:hypothetical protein
VCPGTQVCRDGACFDACDGVSCGEGERCRDGACVPDPCATTMCSEGFRCVEGSCIPDGPIDAGTGSGMLDGGAVRMPPSTGGCCRIAGGSRDLPGLAIAALALAAWWARRRR